MSALPPESGSGDNPDNNGGSSPFGGAAGGLGNLFNRMKNAVLAEPDAARDAFFRAVKKGDVEAVRTLLAQGVSPNLYNSGGDTALILAATKDDAEMVAALVAAGADPKLGALLDRDRTALKFAVDFGAENAAETLVRLGAYNGDLSLLHRACEKGKARVVAAMVAAGADASGMNANGTTPLMSALGARKTAVAMTLLKAPDVVAALNLPLPQDAQGRTPFHLGVLRGDVAVVAEMIALGGFVNLPTLEGHMPLHIAIERGDADLVALLLAKGADATGPVCDAKGAQVHPAPLLFLCGVTNMDEDRRLQIAQHLFAAGARANDVDVVTGDTALHRLMSARNITPTLSFLLTVADKLNICNNAGNTPLLEAIESAGIHDIANLLAAGADPNGRHDGDLRTPLMTAAAYGQANTLRELLKAGANPRLLDAKGHSALFYAQNNIRMAAETVPLLEEALRRDAKPLFRGWPPAGGKP